MAFTFDPTWNNPGNHTGVPTMSTQQEVEDRIVAICATKTATIAQITALLGLISARSGLCTVQKGLHQDEMDGTLGAEQHVRIRAPIGPGRYVTFHIYVSILVGRTGRGKSARATAVISLSSISFIQGTARVVQNY